MIVFPRSAKMGCMAEIISRITVTEYIPVIRAIFGFLEVTAVRYPDLDQKDRIRVMFFENDPAKIMYAMSLINVWLKGSKFRAESIVFTKTDPKAKWSEMMSILRAKIAEHYNDSAVIALALSRSGRVTREIGGLTFTHDFEGDGLKVDIIRTLRDEGGFVRTSGIQHLVGSKSVESISKTIAAINVTLAVALQLPQDKKLIESKRGSGYRINLVYNLVTTK